MPLQTCEIEECRAKVRSLIHGLCPRCSNLAERMQQNYFTWHKHGDTTHVKGSFSFALISGEKPV